MADRQTRRTEIDALVERLDRGHRMSCSDPSDPTRKTHYSEARDAITYLLNEIDQRDASSADVAPLSPQVERGVECFHGTPHACAAIRCGSNCNQRFDRMHPCPACLIASIHDLRAKVTALGGDPYAPLPTTSR